MTRQVAFLMRASNGGLTHKRIMRLTWRQFLVYLDSFTWLLREESEEGRGKNRRDDLRAMTSDPRVVETKRSMVEETRKIVERHKKLVENQKGAPADAKTQKLL